MGEHLNRKTPTWPMRIRALLRQHPEGLTEPDIARLLEVDRKRVCGVCKFMRGTYISHFQVGTTGPHPSVWKLYEGPGRVPADAVRPPKKELPRLLPADKKPAAKKGVAHRT